MILKDFETVSTVDREIICFVEVVSFRMLGLHLSSLDVQGAAPLQPNSTTIKLLRASEDCI
jgi:hypothetical protein